MYLEPNDTTYLEPNDIKSIEAIIDDEKMRLYFQLHCIFAYEKSINDNHESFNFFLKLAESNLDARSNKYFQLNDSHDESLTVQHIQVASNKIQAGYDIADQVDYRNLDTEKYSKIAEFVRETKDKLSGKAENFRRNIVKSLNDQKIHYNNIEVQLSELVRQLNENYGTRLGLNTESFTSGHLAKIEDTIRKSMVEKVDDISFLSDIADSIHSHVSSYRSGESAINAVDRPKDGWLGMIYNVYDHFASPDIVSLKPLKDAYKEIIYSTYTISSTVFDTAMVLHIEQQDAILNLHEKLKIYFDTVNDEETMDWYEKINAITNQLNKQITRLQYQQSVFGTTEFEDLIKCKTVKVMENEEALNYFFHSPYINKQTKKILMTLEASETILESSMPNEISMGHFEVTGIQNNSTIPPFLYNFIDIWAIKQTSAGNFTSIIANIEQCLIEINKLYQTAVIIILKSDNADNILYSKNTTKLAFSELMREFNTQNGIVGLLNVFLGNISRPIKIDFAPINQCIGNVFVLLESIKLHAAVTNYGFDEIKEHIEGLDRNNIINSLREIKRAALEVYTAEYATLYEKHKGIEVQANLNTSQLTADGYESDTDEEEISSTDDNGKYTDKIPVSGNLGMLHADRGNGDEQHNDTTQYTSDEVNALQGNRS